MDTEPRGETSKMLWSMMSKAAERSRRHRHDNSVTMPSLVGLGFHPPPGRPKTLSFLVCLSVCLSVRHVLECQSLCARFHSPGRRWTRKMFLIPLDRGRFVVVHPCSAFSDWCQLATSLNPKSKTRQNWGFSPPEGDRIHRSRRNLASKRMSWVCSSAPNLALIGKRESVQQPPNIKICPKL